jgi:hypothetical protein
MDRGQQHWRPSGPARTDDVIFMVPGREPFGEAEFVAAGDRLRGAGLDGRVEIREIEIFGPRAVMRNHIEAVLTAPGASPGACRETR